MANPVVFRSSKVFAFIHVAQINGSQLASDTSATSMVVDAGHRLIVGMDVLIEDECVKVTAIDSNTITINRAEVTHTSATTTTAATHADDTPIFAWSELVDSNDTPLMQHFSLIDDLYKPRMVTMTLANPFSGEKATVPAYAAAVYDVIKGAEAMHKYDLVEKGLAWFSRKFPNQYMVLLD